MGILRTYLAVCVLFAHCPSYFGIDLPGGRVAVQLFYFISGFYMFFILDKKYENRIYLFYKKRLWRLLPLYYLILLSSLMFELLKYFFSDSSKIELYLNPNISNGTLFSLALSQLQVLGQELFMFLKLGDTGSLEWGNFRHSTPRLHQFLLIPQAWTIGLEIYFYALVPLCFRYLNFKKICFVVLTGLVLRVFAHYKFSLWSDPWTYRFFPFELFVFLMGSASYLLSKKNIPSLLGKGATVLTAVILLFSSSLISSENVQVSCLLALSVFAIPYIFKLTINNKLDIWIGEFSYPVYMIHILILNVLQVLFPSGAVAEVVFVLSFIISYTLNRFFLNQLEFKRRRMG